MVGMSPPEKMPLRGGKAEAGPEAAGFGANAARLLAERLRGAAKENPGMPPPAAGAAAEAAAEAAAGAAAAEKEKAAPVVAEVDEGAAKLKGAGAPAPEEWGAGAVMLSMGLTEAVGSTLAGAGATILACAGSGAGAGFAAAAGTGAARAAGTGTVLVDGEIFLAKVV